MSSVLNKTTLQHIESVNTPDYSTSTWIHNPDISLWDTVPKKYTKVESDLLVEMSQAEKDTVDSDDLSDYKQNKYSQIDYKTGALIYAGFVFDSQTFSLSVSAQTNWNALKDQEAEFTFPLDISTINNDTYSLTQANLDNFWSAARDTTKGHLDSGRVLKKSVFDAVDQAAVDLVVDDR